MLDVRIEVRTEVPQQTLDRPRRSIREGADRLAFHHARQAREQLDVAGKMEGATICAFSDAAAWPIQGLLRHFRDDFVAHIREGKCPFPESFEL